MSELGLTTIQGKKLLAQYGPNEVAEKKTGIFKKFLSPFFSPISLMLLGAAFLSELNGRKFDFYFIIALYFVNYFVQKLQEFKADKAIKELKNKLSFEVSTRRNGQWRQLNAKLLVPGDYIRLNLGSIIPADAEIVATKNLAVNEAVLTGESMPKEKKIGDKIFSGAFITAGSLEAKVTATGKHTYFGKTIFSIEPPAQKSILEKDILSIARFLAAISIAAVFVLTLVFTAKGFPFRDLLTLDLSLIIAGIPVALPAVMTIILSIGAAGLAKKMVIVRRLSALQDLANVNLLLTDKTGTLTRNEIKVANVISYEKGLSTDDVVELAAYAASADIPDAIDTAVLKRREQGGHKASLGKILNFIPYDPDRKRSTALVQKGTEKILISLGAPQVIKTFDDFENNALKKKFDQDIQRAANDGFRVLAVAIKKISSQTEEQERKMKIIGSLFLADPLDESSKDTINFLQKNGIAIKILTGDNRAIAERIARELELTGPIVSQKEMQKNDRGTKIKYEQAAAFAEILPKEKYDILRMFKPRYIIAATGDGINDLPALKIADVSIAVSRAVTALKSLADIVLLGRGLAVIKDAILESRKIFVRLYNYSVYRISESFRLIVSILILGLWYGFYPLEPLQLILLALLNDIPIISLAVDRVKTPAKPAEIKAKERLGLSLLFGSVGLLNSILMFVLMTKIFHLSLPFIQTMFFLKLTVSGHMLIFVAHTKERWFKYLPSKQVIFATCATQIIATILALTGFLMPSKISFSAVILVWGWALFWMQISELMKDLQNKILSR